MLSMVCVGNLPVNSSLTAVAAVHWWNALRLASLHPWLISSRALIRRATSQPYPILHHRQQHVAMETDDVTAQATPTTQPEMIETCDSIRKPLPSPSSAHA